MPAMEVYIRETLTETEKLKLKLASPLESALSILGALEAANGVLMFGLTTGFLYTILSGMLERYWEEQTGQGVESER